MIRYTWIYGINYKIPSKEKIIEVLRIYKQWLLQESVFFLIIDMIKTSLILDSQNLPSESCGIYRNSWYGAYHENFCMCILLYDPCIKLVWGVICFSRFWINPFIMIYRLSVKWEHLSFTLVLSVHKLQIKKVSLLGSMVWYNYLLKKNHRLFNNDKPLD